MSGKSSIPCNAARDFQRFAARTFNLLEPYGVDVPCKNAEGDLETVNLPVILPHEYIYHMYHQKPKLYRESSYSVAVRQMVGRKAC